MVRLTINRNFFVIQYSFDVWFLIKYSVQPITILRNIHKDHKERKPMTFFPARITNELGPV